MKNLLLIGFLASVTFATITYAQEAEEANDRTAALIKKLDRDKDSVADQSVGFFVTKSQNWTANTPICSTI